MDDLRIRYTVEDNRVDFIGTDRVRHAFLLSEQERLFGGAQAVPIGRALVADHGGDLLAICGEPTAGGLLFRRGDDDELWADGHYWKTGFPACETCLPHEVAA